MKPVLQALVLADHVYTDVHSGKKVIAGTFNRLWARKFPSLMARTTYAFICLTDVQGKVHLQLRYVDLETNNVLLENRPLTVTSDNRLDSSEVIVEVAPFPMPHAGFYAFELYAGDDLLGALRLTVSKIEEDAKQ